MNNLHLSLKHLLSIFLLLILTSAAFCQQKGTITGKIITPQNEPAENVSVSLKDTEYGAITNEEGKYTFRVTAGSYILIVSHFGLKNQEIQVTVQPGKTANVPSVTVNTNINSLQEVSINANKTNKFKRKRSIDVAKMPLEDLENPQVYTNITKALLTEQNVTTVDGAIKNSPGLQTMWEATGRSGDGGSYYNSRGFILQSQLRNGVAGNVSNTIDAVNLESIEVIKGPSATLFGSSLTSYGGLINRVTKKPYENFGGEVSYMLGSYGLNRVSLDLNTPLDSAKKLLFRLNGAFNYQGSFQDHGFSRGVAIDPSLSYKVNDRRSFRFDAEIYTGRNVGKTIYFFPYGQTVAGLGASRADQLGVDYYKSYNAGDLAQQSKTYNFFGQVNYKISDHWSSQTNFTSTYSYSNGFGPYYYLLANDSISRNDQSTKNSWQKTLEVQQNFNGDFKIGNLRNRFVGGLDFFRNNSNQFFFGSTYDVVPTNSNSFNYGSFNKGNMDAIYASGAPLGFTYPSIFKANTYSAYVSDVLNITDRLLALASVRFDHFDNKGNYSPATQAITGAYIQNALSPKFGLVYQVVKEQVSLFANYQNGFTNETGTDYAGKTFKPEQANQLEGGVKVNLFDGKLSSTLSYYRINVKDVIRPYLPNPNFSIQDGTQLSKGFEAEVIANPLKGINIVAGFSYNDSKYTKASTDVEGRRPGTASSPYTANLWISYRLPKETIDGLGFGFGGNYASDNKVVNSVSQGVFILPAYTILNATAFYDVSRYRFSFGVNNLTDKKYWIGYTTVNPQTTRQAIGTIAYKF
ncbi:TonB-dependent receptor [Mucilaginibacter sp.]|uniref:TonB-dependent receptor n=1 Tax=Mucilaginibacter sp. TaxID=1882438 RepID=UPI0026292065|nr:TonB-dependent receptor [Mucilaginibacter sp.]MDB4923412.1 TonB-dependent receptor [Mucilaginibacter sp.]